MSRAEFFKRFREIALEGVDRWLLAIEIILLPGLIPSVRKWLALVSGMWILNTNEFWMTLLFVVAIVLILRSTKRMIEADRAMAEDDLYAASEKAWAERAFCIFYRLHKHGKSLLESNSGPSQAAQAWRDWDRKVRKELADHCEPNILQMYLGHTSRLDSNGINDPLSAESYQTAVDFIVHGVLDCSLPHVFKRRR